MPVTTSKHSAIVLLVLTLIISLTWLMVLPSPINATASIIDIDANSGNTGDFSSLALNSSGFAVISYFAAEFADLRLAVCNDALCSNPTITTIDSVGSVGIDTSLKLNSNGFPVISYGDTTNHSLKVAVCGDALCNTKTITAVDGNNGDNSDKIYISLELSSRGFPVISYFDNTNFDLKLAVCGDAICTSKTLTTIDSTGNAGEYSSLTLTADDYPIIGYSAFRTLYEHELRLAACADAICTAKTITTVDNVGDVGWYISLVLAPNGFPVISYERYGPGDLLLAVCGNITCAQREITEVDSDGMDSAFISLALNNSGYPVISYEGDGLKLVVCENVLCTNKTITTIQGIVENEGRPLGQYTSLALLNGEIPIVSYTNWYKKKLSVALCSNAPCNTKTIKDLDILHNVGDNNSLALSSSGYPVIAYHDSTNGDLKLAVCNDMLCTSKVLSVVDSAGSVGASPSLRLSASGFPVISYYDFDHGDLKLAVCGDALCTTKTLRTIDGAGDIGTISSLALASNGYPVISYYDYTNADLKLAVCGDLTCGSKTITTIESTGNVGASLSLALNTNNFPIIAYSNSANHSLNLAVCNDILCASKTISVLDINFSFSGISLLLSSSGLPIISYARYGELKIAVCSDVMCNNKTVTVIDADDNLGYAPTLALSNVGRPVISYLTGRYPNYYLKVAVCQNIFCTSSKVLTTNNTGLVYALSSGVSSSNRVYVSYYDAVSADLKMYTDDEIIGPPSTEVPTNTPFPPHPDTIGVYKNGTFYLRNSNSNGAADITATFGGDASDVPVVGDWNGDGVDTIGVYRRNTGVFFLSDSNIAPSVSYSVVFGNPNDTPFAGRWTSDMAGSGVGVYRNSNGILYQKKTLTTGFSDYFAIFGNPGDQGFAGDWNSDGFDSIGVYRTNQQYWLLSNNSTPSGITYSSLDFYWGINSNLPVVGDWDGNGNSTAGYFDYASVFILHANNGTAGADTTIVFGPAGGKPIAGKWVAANRPTQAGYIIGGGSNGSKNDSDNNRID